MGLDLVEGRATRLVPGIVNFNCVEIEDCIYHLSMYDLRLNVFVAN